MKRHPIQPFGAILGIAGGAMLAGVFLIVLVNGKWPDFLQPLQALFQTISNLTGDAALIIEIWLFVGPGALIYYWGKKLTDKQQRNVKDQ